MRRLEQYLRQPLSVPRQLPLPRMDSSRAALSILLQTGRIAILENLEATTATEEATTVAMVVVAMVVVAVDIHSSLAATAEASTTRIKPSPS